MQISAANLLASQQASRTAPRPAPAKEPDAFEPLIFKQTAKPQAETAPAAPSAYVRPGTHLDIKV